MAMEQKIDSRDPFNMTDRKRNIILGVMAVMLIAAIVISFFINIPLTEETYYSTFSTIADSIIALVAFLGAVVLFRLQLYENKRNSLAEKIAIIALAGDPLIPQYIGSTLIADEIIATAKAKVSEIDGLLNQARVKKMLEEVDNIDFSSKIIKTRIKDFSLMAVCCAVLSIIGLFLTPFLFGSILHSSSPIGNASVSIGNVYLFCVTIFSCFSLVFGLRVILEIFNSF